MLVFAADLTKRSPYAPPLGIAARGVAFQALPPNRPAGTHAASAEHLNIENLFTAAANALRIGIATGRADARPDMKERVIGPVLANHKVARPVVASVPIHVMDFSLLWQRPAECCR